MIAALPLAWLLHPALDWVERLGAFLAFEVFLALWIVGFVVLGRWIGAFEPDEYAAGR